MVEGCIVVDNQDAYNFEAEGKTEEGAFRLLKG
jgi:hypothetical protein